MEPRASIRIPSRRDPVAGPIIRRWRELTGGGKDRHTDRRTLIACSGGADSSALALSLSASSSELVVAHVVHDLRPRREVLADRDAARRLADLLGLEFVEHAVRVSDLPGNAESNARSARLEALESLARATGCSHVATAHHADDQLETVLMRLIRGAGPRGLGGIRPARLLGDRGIRLIRPMLCVDRADAEDLCCRCGWQWTHDATNDNRSRLRAALRHGVVPELRRLHPRAAHNASRAAESLALASEAIESRALALIESVAQGPDTEELCWDRATLRNEPEPVLASLVGVAVERLASGRGLDGLNALVRSRIAGTIREQHRGSRRFDLRAAVISIESSEVLIRARRSPEPGAAALDGGTMNPAEAPIDTHSHREMTNV